MPKKMLVILCLVPMLFAGCKNSHRIESASVIENVSVESKSGQLFYTFYLLTDSDEPEAVEIPADSFKKARSLAGSRYIPNMTLAKLELLLIAENVDREIMRGDIEYISTQASFSPIAKVALCDGGALAKVRKSVSAQTMIEKQIILCKNNHPEVNSDYLSVFNCYADKKSDSFSVPFVTASDELKVSQIKIEKNEK